MALTIQETFQVAAAPQEVWTHLMDPKEVVECLSGAELLDAPGERTFRGRMKVSVGPVKVVYEGTAEFVDVDEEALRVRVQAQGQEVSGSGSARMTMESTVVEGPEGGTEVRVDVSVDVAGKIVQFGRGMIQTVSKELFRQFSDCFRSRLEESPEDEAAAATTDLPPTAEPGPRSEKEPIRPLRLLFSALRQKLRSLLGRK